MAATVRVGVTLQGPAATLGPTARELEDAGVASVWVGDYFQSGLVRAAVIGAATSTVAVGTHVLQAFARSPLATALAAQELQDLTGGRFRLGLGSQLAAANRRWHGVDVDRPLVALREYVGAVRTLLAAPPDESAEFTGSRFIFRVPPFRVATSVAAPPVWIGGFGAGSVRLAAEVADGLAGHLLWTDAHVRTAVRPSLGARPLPVTVARLVAGPSVEDGHGDLARRLAHYLVTPAYVDGLHEQGVEYDRPALLEALRTADRVAIERTVTPYVPAFCIEDVDDLARHREHAAAAGIDELVLLAPMDPAAPERTQALERSIVELLRRA